jgi:hypothetical protein
VKDRSRKAKAWGTAREPDGTCADTHPASVRLSSSDDKRTRFEKFGHLLNAAERALFDKMTAPEQDFLLEKQTPVGQARYQPVHSSVT